MKDIIACVGRRTLIQGGAFRLDRGPTQAELDSFKAAVEAYGGCRAKGHTVELGCIVNDLGIRAGKRPKATGRLMLPREYIGVLQDACVPTKELRIWYESTLRNRAVADARRGRSSGEGLKINERTGTLVPLCAGIMGRFYRDLADEGISLQIGFYAWEDEAESCVGRRDRACPMGPLRGAEPGLSGYPLGIELMNYWVYAGGEMNLAMRKGPGERA